jgi:predicted small lipoprotein YifL
MSRLRWFVLLAFLVALAGCGDDGDEAGPPAPPPAPTAAAEAETSVEVVVYLPTLGGGGLRYRLSCDPPTGTHPTPKPACDALAAHADALRPVPDDAVCTQQFGGRRTALVRGIVAGEEVEATFTRRNGCEIARWDSLGPLLNIRP